MKTRKSHRALSFVAILLCAFLFSSGVSAMDWIDFQGSPAHNGVIDANIPTKPADAALYWALQVQGNLGWDAAPSHPIIVDDTLIFFANTTIYKVDVNNGEVLQEKKSLTATSSWNITNPTYGDGKIFMALKNGQIQAVDFDTLDSVWVYKNDKGGQSNCPVTYHNGAVYTGFWRSTSAAADFVCVDAKTGKEKWALTHNGGFYWAGCYATDNYVLVGSDDGSGINEVDDSTQTRSAVLYSLDPDTGEIIDKIDDINGDIRSTVAFVDGVAYFTSGGASFYGVPVSEDGHFDKAKMYEIALDGTSTSTPVVYNGRAYIGVRGKTGSFDKYGGHHISVIDIASRSIVYSCPTIGYVQTSGVLTTAYEESDGSVYVYFIENYTPGKVRFLKDKPGQTQMEPVTAGSVYSDILFTPAGEHEQYAICSPIVDSYGTLYFKNDSGYIMAVGQKIEKIEVTKAPNKTSYYSGDRFDPTGMEVTATLKNGVKKDVTKYVTIPTEPLDVDDIDVTIGYELQRYGDGELTDAAKDVQTSGVVIPTLYTSVFVEVQSRDQLAADEVKALIDAIGTVTADSGDAIQAARTAYDKLTAAQKELVTNYATLTAAEDDFAAKRVVSLIDAIGTVTKDSGDAIRAARDAYAALTAAQKLRVNNYGYLAQAIAQYDRLVNPFKDVATKDYFYDAVLWAIENDITSGMTATSFGPKQECTRGQVVTFLWRASGSPKATNRSNPFKDVKSDAYYYDAVLWAVEQNITQGMTATTFGPDAVCTRGQVVTFQWRAAKSPAVTAKVSFSDVKVGAYYEKAVTWAVSKGITNGLTPTTFGPDSKCQRGQIVTFLYRGK